MGQFNDLTGQRFGRLTVVSMERDKRRGWIAWRCVCDCGNERIIRTGDLKNGNTQSCGCFRKDEVRERNTTHGCTGTRLFGIWLNMKNRCTYPSDKFYKDYGGRGIKVCDEWFQEFQCFHDWAVGHGYSDDLTIDRIDVNGNYCPENCRWVSQSEQANNKRNNILITYNGETHTLKEWSRIIGIHVGTLRTRIIKEGWPVERAFIEPVRQNKKRNG